MKTIYLKVIVPDDVKTSQIRVSYPGVLPNIAAGFTEIYLPTEEGRDDAIEKFYLEKKPDENISTFQYGADWYKSQIEKQ